MSVFLADVSEFQDVINWPMYGRLGSRAAIVRVHNGWRDDYFKAANVAGARANCDVIGFYQYLPGNVDPVAAANAYQKSIGTLRPGEIAILDLEEGIGDQTGRAAAWHATLHDSVEWTYSGAYFAKEHLGGSVEWVAAYGQGNPNVPGERLWQFTNAMSFAGISRPCDGSVFSGSLAQLQVLAGDVIVPPPTPVIPVVPKPPVTPAFAVADVRALQTALGAKADGLYGPDTDNRAGNFRNAAIGAYSNLNVILVQQILHVTADGAFGPATRAAVFAKIPSLQKIYKVKGDGAWGARTDTAYQTMRKLFYK